jgi:death-on-curing protein
VDGNKRVAHASMEIFLNLNGLELKADVDSQEELMLFIASGDVSHEELAEWLKDHTTKK